MVDIKFIHGDCLEEMPKLADKSIDLTVTSPPYDNLRTYNGNSQFDFQGIAKELFRVTKDGGVVVWVVADATIKGSETGTSFKQALYFKEIGFNLHDTMIWVKDGGGAIGSQLCYVQNFEYMFVFSKGKPASINRIRDKANLSFGKDKSGVGRRTKEGFHKIEQRKLCGEFSVRNNWWYVPPEKGEHPAVFPLRLATDHILSWSSEGDTILDPFAGSGTTGIAALNTGRKFVLIEKDAGYCEIIKKRIESHQPLLQAVNQ
jgi:site-specific DNA-methyltransferase (adenine-specific)